MALYYEGMSLTRRTGIVVRWIVGVDMGLDIRRDQGVVVALLLGRWAIDLWFDCEPVNMAPGRGLVLLSNATTLFANYSGYRRLGGLTPRKLEQWGLWVKS